MHKDENTNKTFGYLSNKKKARVWVLVVHHEFKSTDNVRAGNQTDFSKLCHSFTRRNCRFKGIESKSKDEILNFMTSSEKLFSLFAESTDEVVEAPDMFILFILSHGISGGKILTDQLAKEPKDPQQPFEEYRTEDVWNGLKGIKELQECIKLIFFGPCRGLSAEIRLPAAKETIDNNPVGEKSMWFSIQPNCENFIIFYSTVEALKAQRNDTGTWLVTALCTELDCMTTDLDLIVFLTKVQKRICETKTIDSAIGQTPQLQFSKHKEFTVSCFPLNENSDAGSGTDPGRLVTVDRYHFYPWRSTRQLLPFRRGRALIFYDKNHATMAKEMQISFQFLEFETRIYSVSHVTKMIQQVTSVHNSGLSEDGAIAICVLARLLDNSELGLSIVTADKKVAVNEITHSFIGTNSKDLAGKPKLLFFLDGGYRADDPLIGLTSDDFVVEGNNHGGIFTFFGVARSNEDNIVSGLIHELRNPELKNGLSLQEAIVKLLRRYQEPSGEIQFQVVSTLGHLLDFQPCRNAYIMPTFMVEEEKTSMTFEELVRIMKDAPMKPKDKSLNLSWLLRSGTGIGKSAATIELAKRLRETLPDAFIVVHFSFKNFSAYFRTLKIEPHMYVKFLETVLEKNSEPHKSLMSRIEEHKVFILADGFDEICPEYENIASELLRQMNDANLPLWVTTRIHGERTIRDAIAPLQVLDLRPLTREDQIKLLKIFLYQDDEECTALLDKFNRNGKSNDFTGTPMQLKLIAEVGDKVDDVDGGLSFLYYQFVLTKIELYLEGFIGTNRSHQDFESSLIEKLDLLIELTVAAYFYSDEAVSREIIRNERHINHIGIVRFSINAERKLDSVTFEHQSYAEFLLSLLFLSKCGQNLSQSSEPLCQFIDKDRLSDLLLQSKFDQVRSFINSFYFGDSSERKIEATKLEPGTIEKLKAQKVNLMSYICKEDQENLFSLFFESKLKDNFGDICDLLNSPFEYVFRNETYKYYPLIAACYSSNEKLALHLLDLGARLDLLLPENCLIENESSILHLAAKRNFTKIAEIVANRYPNLIYKKERSSNRIPLDYAAKRGNLECLKILIDLTDGEEAKIEMRKRALEIASTNGHTELVLYLMGENLEVKKDRYGLTPLYHAAVHGRTHLIKALLAKIPGVANEHHVCTDGLTAVHGACFFDQREALEILHQNGADLNTRTSKKYNSTPLHSAASHNSIGCISYLLTQGVDVNAVNTYGETPYHYAAANGRLQTLQLLLKHGADIYKESKEQHLDKDTPVGKLTPLDSAAMNSHIDCLDYLLNFPYTDEMRKHAMWVALTCAINDDKVEIIDVLKLFLERGFSVDLDLVNGQTPIIVLAQRSHEWFKNFKTAPKQQTFSSENYNTDAPFHPRPREITLASPGKSKVLNPFIKCIVHLIKCGANLDVVSDIGSALHVAAENGDVLLLTLLMFKRAQASVTFYPFNHTPLHLAARNGHLEVVKILLHQKGVNVNARSFCNETPVQLALENKHTSLVELLLMRGADVTSTFGLIDPDHYILACKAAELGLRKALELILGVAPYDGDQRQLDGALVGAARAGRIDLLCDLVQMGANPTNSNLDRAFSTSPLVAAIRAGKSESVDALFLFMDAVTQAEEASTALVVAVEKRDLSLVISLVEQKGADINRADKRQFSPITRATQWGLDNIVDYFLNFEHVNLLAPSFNGKTPELFIDHVRNLDIRNRLVRRIEEQKLDIVVNC